MPVRRIIVFPAWQESNPYLNIIYLAARARGVHLDGHIRLGSLLDALKMAGKGDMLHMHWTAAVCQKAATAERAAQNLADLAAAIRSFKARGGRVLWTVHNVLPHETRYRDIELELNAFLGEVSDVVHVMSEATFDLLQGLYHLPPEKHVQIPHPSYQGLHVVTPADREAGRSRLGIPAERKVLLFFGQMRPYKGLDTLLQALGCLADAGLEVPLLLLAGRADDDVRNEVEAAIPPGVDVISHFGYVPDEELPTWFGAADLAVFPFRQILNSGSLHLSATMGVPVALPGEAHLRDQFDGESWVRFYDPEDRVEGLRRVLADDASYERPTASMRAFSERLSPWHVSRRMADLMTAVGS